MYIIDVTNPLTMLLLLAATVLLIFLGKEVKKPIAPAIALAFFLILVGIHSIQLAKVTTDALKSLLVQCISMDLIMIFITFFGYLWVDDIACKFYKKKSIDNSLDWFWKNV